MTMNNKILPVALVAALLGGSVGALVMRPSKTTETPASSATVPAASTTETTPTTAALPASDAQTAFNVTSPSDERLAYREGFTEGVRAARDEEVVSQPTSSTVTRTRSTSTNRVAYRAPARARASRASNSRQVYYDYNNEPRKRSFWSKHRDKLTVAGGAGGGALLGGLIGGKKGAAIGAITGGGGSALYTYKIRKKNPRRY